tara:strand:+ start:7476 stop:7712 length:237 start_codon:yes stop_codon:yes gene_type:complete
MNLTINGEKTFIKNETPPITVEILIKELGYHPQLIVIEFNGTILDPKMWSNQMVKDGDKLEIVTIVGGGSESLFNLKI